MRSTMGYFRDRAGTMSLLWVLKNLGINGARHIYTTRDWKPVTKFLERMNEQ